jgi:hypothetical protein
MPRPKSSRYILGHLKCPNPSCQRHFSTDRAVKCHLNHPSSLCHFWVKSLEAQDNVEEDRDRLDHIILQDSNMSDCIPSYPDTLPDCHPTCNNDMQDMAEKSDTISQVDEKIDIEQAIPQHQPVKEGFEETFLGAAQTYGQGLDVFDYITHCDANAPDRESNSYYPFSCFTDWEVARWLSRLNVPMYAVDEFFKLKYVCAFKLISCCFYKLNTYFLLQVQDRPLSFKSSRELRNLVEQLPSPPSWLSTNVVVPGGSSKKPLTLYYRDTLQCFRHLFGNPLFKNYMEYEPKRVWEDESMSSQIYTEMMTGELAWGIQVGIPFYRMRWGSDYVSESNIIG